MTPEKKVPEKKIKIVSNLKNLINKKRTVLIASIKNIPASQYQQIIKKLRGKAIVKVPRKNLIFKALDSAENEQVQKLKEQFKDSTAIIFSDLDSFDLASELIESTTPAKARAGQVSDKDIKIDAGPTDLPPGPAISELGNLGIPVQIEKGKIHIKQPKVIVKNGEKISTQAAEVMNKLNIKPFKVGFKPLAAFDSEDKKLYTEIKINKEETLESLKEKYSKALAFAVEISYINEDTIKFLISKAGMHEKVMEKLIGEKPEEEKEETEGKESEKKEKTTSDNSEKENEDKEKQESNSEENKSEKSKE